jgi:hypothetical protein
MHRRLPGLLACYLIAAPIFAQDAVPDFPSFVYTNDDSVGNTVSGFLVLAGGSLTAIPGSPFSTGGIGTGTNGLYASNKIASAGKFLYVSNGGGMPGVSGFVINATTGALTLISGSPFFRLARSELGRYSRQRPIDCRE